LRNSRAGAEDLRRWGVSYGSMLAKREEQLTKKKAAKMVRRKKKVVNMLTARVSETGRRGFCK
jgi:hypothetical protein